MITKRIAFFAILLNFAFGCRIVSAQDSGLRFEISFPAAVHPDAITGRVFLLISRDNSKEPRLQITRTGPALFGRDIEHLAPGQPAAIDESDLGAPVPSLRDLPAGDYYVQAVINIYSEFHRADGHTVWMHDDQWEGQDWTRSPGNLISTVEHIHLDSHSSPARTIKLVTEDAIPPVVIPADTEWVERFKFQSPSLTKFWGRPIYLGATVLLPKDYARETISYPVLYEQGHFDIKAPLNFRTEPPTDDELNAGGMTARAAKRGYELYQAWPKENFPRMIVVTFQHPNPYFDDSYAVNSPNVGPYGDAIMQELIPEIEKRYRVIREPYARILAGGSTGGWEALALQFFHPDFFGGTWGYCPDPVTFTNVEGINAYSDANAFHKDYEWRREPTINSIETDGRVRLTSEQRNHLELVNGTHGRSGEQIDIWSAVFGPVGSDGYFEPLFNKRTGEINPTVAQYWKDHFDLLEYLKRNWPTLGPKLVDKVHIYVGTMDTYQLNVAVRELEDWMKTTENPHYEGFFVYGVGEPHCWSGTVTHAARLIEIADFIAAKSPYVTATPWWKR
ncbi:MAG: alpha/beta hydrolase-fold protein [Candidatus Acidiferrales bacterium]